MVAVPDRRWLFTRGSNCKVLTGKVLDWWSLMEGGHLREVVYIPNTKKLEKQDTKYPYCSNEIPYT